VNVASNLLLGGTLNIADGGGFTDGNYLLFTCGSTVAPRTLQIGARPGGHSYAIDTTTPGQVNLVVTCPPDATISVPPWVCAGSTANTATVPDAGPGATYAWTISGNGTITYGQTGNSVAFTAGASGSFALSCTVTTAAGCASGGSQNKSVLINPLPDATITAPSAVLYNSTGNVASVPDAGVQATYEWTISGGTITSGQTGRTATFTAGASGVVTLNCRVITVYGCISGGSQNKSVTIVQTSPPINLHVVPPSPRR
jgi:hypothetical protein